MKKIFLIKNSVEEYNIRTETIDGRDHWIVPIIMMVEGVHNGSDGPVLYTADELGTTPSAWDGSPVVINHPVDRNGTNLSANTPELVKEIVGRIHNTRMDGLQLRAEAWLDILTLQETSPTAFQHIEEHNALDVSIGAFMSEEIVEGEFNNEQYRAIAHHLRPDHLALLPNGEGACSWDDGCGVRINKNKEGGINVEDLKKLSIDEMLNLGYVTNGLTDNETGFREIMTNVQQKLDQLDNSSMVHFLEELFDDHFIYRVHSRESGDTTFFKRDFTVNEDGSVDFEGDPVEVRKEVSFETVNNNSSNNNVKSKSKGMKRNNKPCKVDGLIANKATQFTEDDRKWLDTLEDDQLERLTPVDIEPEVTASSSSDDKSKEDKSEDKKNEPAVNSDKDDKKSQEEFATNVKAVLSEDPEAFIETYMPDDVKRSIKSGLSMYKEKRENLVKGIVANSSFEEANLLKWDDDNLQKLYDSVVPEADFSVMGSSNSSSKTLGEDDAEEMEAMITNVEIKEEKK